MGIIAIFLVVSSLMVWFAYKENYYSNYIANHDWCCDAKWSAVGHRSLNFTTGIQSDYFDNLFTELDLFFDNNTQGLVLSHTDLISCILRDYDDPFDPLDDSNYFTLHTFRTSAEAIFENSIIKGNVPSNYSELLLLQLEGSTQDINLNDTISLRPASFLRRTSYQNYSITGVLDDVDSTLELLGYSGDLITNDFFSSSYFSDYHWGGHPLSAHFFTTPENFIEIMNSYSFFDSIFYFIMDCSYNASMLDYSQLDTNINLYLNYWESGTSLSSNSNITFHIGHDIYSALNEFKTIWKIETTKVFALTFSFVFLILLLFIEILYFKEKELSGIFHQLKIYGLDNKTLNKVILLDSLVASIVSFIGGTITGIFFGALFTIAFQFDHRVILSFTFLRDSLYLFLSVFVFVAFFLLNYLFRRTLLKKTEVTTAQSSSKKRMNVIRKIFAKTEVILIIPGVLFLSSGLVGVAITSDIIYWAVTITTTLSFLLSLFTFLLFTGTCLTLITCFIVSSKVLFKFLSFLSEKSWQKKKIPITLALKNVVSFSKVYQRLLVGLFLIGICIIPGMIIPSLIKRQNEENATLALGCTDLTIDNWNNNQSLKFNLENIENIHSTTTVIQMDLYSRMRTSSFGYRYFYIKLLVINASEFIDTVDLDRISSKVEYNKEDIESLNENLTFFVNSKSVKKLNLDNENVLNTNEIFNSEENFELVFANSFNIFPAMEKFEQENLVSFFDSNSIKMSLLLNINSYYLLADSITNSEISSLEKRLLIRTKPEADLAKIKEEIKLNLGLDAYSIDDKINEMNKDISRFSLRLFQIYSILSIIGLICFSVLCSNGVYSNQIKIVEINYRIGNSRREIMKGFLVEILIASLLPILISIISSIVFIPIYITILNVNQQYLSFNYRIPFWILFLAFIIAIIIINCSWMASIYLQLQHYKIVKQE